VKKLLFRSDKFHYYDDYSMDGITRGHRWKIENNIVYFALSFNKTSSHQFMLRDERWYKDNPTTQQAYHQYLSRLITNE